MHPIIAEKLRDQTNEYAQEIGEDFCNLFKRWLQKAPELTVVSIVHLPMSLVMSTFLQNVSPVRELVPDLPEVFILAMKPFETLQYHWGKISNEEFCSLYRKYYIEQLRILKNS